MKKLLTTIALTLAGIFTLVSCGETKPEEKKPQEDRKSVV